MFKKFSDELKEARVKAGITLEKVAAKTRIDIKFLEAMEGNNFSFLPEIYVKAFIKQYAKVVGLKEEETVQKYLLAKEGKKNSIEAEKQNDQKGEDSGKVENKPELKVEEKTVKSFDDSSVVNQKSATKKKQNPIIIGGAAISVIIITLLVYFLFLKNGSEIIVEEKPYDEVLQETPKRFVEDKTDKSSDVQSMQNLEAMTLTISNVDSTDSAWVMVVMDDTTSREFLLLPKISATVKAYKDFQFTLGNSGVIELTFDNNKLEFEGRRGAVRFFKLDKNGLERIYSPPQINRE